MELDNIKNQETNSIHNLMKQSKIYWQIKKEVLSTILKHKTNVIKPDLQDIIKSLTANGNDDKLKGLIHNCLQKSTRRLPIQTDTNPQIEFYRLKWSEMITKQFNNMANKIVREQQYDQQDQSVTYVYDCGSLLQFLSSIKIKHSFAVRDSSACLFPNQILKVCKYAQIKSKYSFLNNPQNILGNDLDSDLRERQKKAKKIVQGQNITSQIQSYLCLGCINGERVSVYRRYFQCFYQYSGKRIWKHMIKSDSKEILKNPLYFVFKEAIIKIYQTFICDKQLGQMLKVKQMSPSDIKLDKFAPIHGNLPSKCFANYIAPFCYTSTSVQEVYQIFRQVYANYLILLNTISSLPDSILSLCILFQQLLYTTQKKLVAKFQQLHIQPIRIIFPWIFYCFIGYINTEQFFLLFDRIIGMKSLQILPLYCVSILFKEKSAILQSKNQQQIQQILQYSLQQDIMIQTIREFFKYHL